MPLPDEKLTLLARSRYDLAKQHSDPWRTEGKQAYDFVAGHQIDPEDLRELQKNKRPAVVFNLIGPNVKAISGMERGNRHELKYLAREKSDIDGAAAEIYNQTSMWVFDRNYNEFEESKAFRAMSISGMGWTQLRVDFDEDPLGKINNPTIDELRKTWDPSAKAENLKDRRYDFTEVLMDKDEFESLFPDFEEAPSGNVFGQTFEEDFEGQALKEINPDQYVGESDFDPAKQLGKIAVLEYNFFVIEDVFQMMDDNGGVVAEFTERSRFTDMQDNLVPSRELKRQRRYYKAWFNGNTLIEQQENADPHSFTEHCMTGEYDRNKGHWFGVVRAMIDPQRWGNQLFMQMLHIVNSNSKGGFFYRAGAFVNKNKALDDWARGDRGIEIKGQGPITDWILERRPAPIPQAMQELLLFVTGLIPRVSGFNMELIGLAGRDQPGVLEQMRKQAGMTILAPFFDSLRFYRMLKGRTLIHFMRTYLGVERMARILSEKAAANLQVLSLPGVDKFDILVEPSPQSPNQKTANFLMLRDLFQTAPDLLPLVLDLVLEESPLPQSLAQKIAERLKEARQPDPMAQAMQKAELGKLISEAVQNAMDAVLKLVKAKTEEGKPELEQDKLDVAAADSVVNLTQTIIQQQGKANGPARSSE